MIPTSLAEFTNRSYVAQVFQIPVRININASVLNSVNIEPFFCLILLMEDLFYLIEHLPYSSGVFRRDKQSDLLYAQKHQDLTLEP